MKKLIVLVGMMGSGKSTIGRMLAKVLKYRFIDIDKVIEKSQNMTVSAIFNEYGENYFRKLEFETIKEYLNTSNAVLSLGGGAFENSEIRQILKKKGLVIYLKATPECLFGRIKSEIQRPLLHRNFSVETLAFILKKREKNYLEAHLIIDTTKISRRDVVFTILNKLE